MNKNLSFRYLFILAISLVLSSCQSFNTAKIKVMLEDGDFNTNNNVLILPKGSDFTFNVVLDINKLIVDTTYDNYSINETLTNDKRYDTLTFHHVNYSMIVSLVINEAAKITYHDNDKQKEEYINQTHERINTNNDYHYFQKEGYVLTGWKNNNEIISLGSRVSASKDLSLEALYEKESSDDLFIFEEIDNSRLRIKQYLGHEDKVIIPNVTNNKQIIEIKENAFNNLDIQTLVLPINLSSIQNKAFNNCHINELVFFDNITNLSDNSFDQSQIDKVRINAIKEPVYMKTYYATYADKVDRLISLKDQNKIILYSGSSTRFGFDSELIDQTFINYDVVNMGVFAYTNSYPQVEVIGHFIKENDIIIVSPEFDAIDKQINLLPLFDEDFIAMIEANYDILTYLDFKQYQGFFSSFKQYQNNRRDLEKCSYIDTPSSYDEDGNRVTSPSYNRYGDYVVYRQNNEKMISFGVKRAFYHQKYFPKEYLDNFNNCFNLLKNKKASLYYDYSPRMNISISEDSNEESVNELDIYLKENIHMEFLSNAKDSLLSPLYFYATDNHLSTEGVSNRTKRVIKSLLFVLDI